MERECLIDGWENLPEDGWEVVDTMICIPLDGEPSEVVVKLNKREGAGLTKRGELKRTRVIVNPQPLWRKEEKLVRNDTSRSDQLAVRDSRLTRNMFLSTKLWSESFTAFP